MEVDHERPLSLGSPCIGYGTYSSWDSSRVVPMPVRKKEGVDAGKINTKAASIFGPHLPIWSDIEQRSASLFTTTSGNEH
jgi:hypothetical protein